MTTVTRRSFVQGATVASASLFSIGRSRADAPDFTYKWATNLAPSHPINIRGQEAVDRIRKATNGRLVIELYPNNQLGSDTDLLSQIRQGAIEFNTNSPILYSSFIPAIGISGIGFAFKSSDVMFQALDGDLGAHVHRAFDKSPIIALDKIFLLGAREMTTSVRPIHTPDDMKGLKIRVAAGPLYLSTIQAMGAAPVTINFNEVYSALQTKVVDGQDNALSLVQSQRFYEVQKYCSLTNHIWDGQWLYANRQAFEALPKDFQEIVRKSFAQAAEDERSDIIKANDTIVADFKSKGIVFNDTDPDQFRKTLQTVGYYKQWQKKFGDEAWRILEKYAGPIS